MTEQPRMNVESFNLDHRTVDGVHALITDTHITPANVHDSQPYLRRLDRMRQRFGFDVAVAGYPHPHPESHSFHYDRLYTQQKIVAGASFVITQLMFDVREYFDLLERLNSLGIMVPVIPGILPVPSLESLRRTLSMCGANLPAKFFFELEEIHAQGGAEAVKEAGTIFAIEQCAKLLEGGAPGVHLYTLNRAETCLRIVDELRKRGLLP